MSNNCDAHKCIINEDVAIIYDSNGNEINKIESNLKRRKIIDKHEGQGRLFTQKRQDYIKNVVNFISNETIIEGSDSYVIMVKMGRTYKAWD
jgi:hypothetical protein